MGFEDSEDNPACFIQTVSTSITKNSLCKIQGVFIILKGMKIFIYSLRIFVWSVFFIVLFLDEYVLQILCKLIKQHACYNYNKMPL